MNTKKIYSIVFIGHVDAGKSTIGGQILYQLGYISQRTLDKYKAESALTNRESWYLSWALDTNPEERNKGKTTETARTYFYIDDLKIILLDSPGHKLYVSDMINGSNQADIAVLVISARINEFESGFEKKGQTREHVILSKAGGIKKMIVLINKMDDPSVEWSEKRFIEIRTKLEHFLKPFYDDVTFIPISGYLGVNIGVTKENKNESVDDKSIVDKSIDDQKNSLSWYKGPTFLDYLKNINIERDYDHLLMTVIEKTKHLGVTYYGVKVESGILKRGTTIRILPKNQISIVSNIYDDEDVEIEETFAGDAVKIRLNDKINFQKNKLVDFKEKDQENTEINGNDQIKSTDGINGNDVIKGNDEVRCNDEVLIEEIKNMDINKIKSSSIKMSNFSEEIEIGDILTTYEETSSETSLKISNQFTCSLLILETKNIITPGYKAILHVRMNSVECKIVELRKIMKSNGKDKMVKIHFCRQGEKVLARVVCERDVVLKNSSNKKMMDRFALRDEDMTVAIGCVRIIE
ncbi:Eukaryotic peptide chain release factor GTP-binding subunit [Dictyocoela muelleri]|nr:Eukaryotic peptide chain release factor GTP-binding subunit [Dictyocoela muelleri]